MYKIFLHAVTYEMSLVFQIKTVEDPRDTWWLRPTCKYRRKSHNESSERYNSSQELRHEFVQSRRRLIETSQICEIF